VKRSYPAGNRTCIISKRSCLYLLCNSQYITTPKKLFTKLNTSFWFGKSSFGLVFILSLQADSNPKIR
jgi:hypothetical protein